MNASRLALVTGSAGAIGGAIASRLAETGWQVVGLDVVQSPRQENFVHQITGDVSQQDTWDTAAARVKELGGKLHGLVHCAALQICKPLIETEPDEWKRVLDINLGGFYLGCRTLHRALVAVEGSVVGIGSVHARATSANIAAYAASKGALSALVRALSIEWAADNVRVNAVLPGAVDSAMLREGLRRGHLDGVDDQALLDELAKRTVLGRIGRPDDIAAAVAFLLDSESAAFITGSELPVDGGVGARLSTE